MSDTERIYHNGEYLDIPYSGPEDRRQGAALISKAGDRIVMTARKLIPWDEPSTELDEDEVALIKRIERDLRTLSCKIQRSPLERLAAAAEDTSDPVRELLDGDYYGDVAFWMRENGPQTTLRAAFAMLRAADLDESLVAELQGVAAGTVRINGGYTSSRDKGPIHQCEWCQGQGSVYYELPDATLAAWQRQKVVICHVCPPLDDYSDAGEGFVYQEETPEEIYLSEKGRGMISDRQPWSIEDEAKESGYKSLEDAVGDEWDVPDWFETQVPAPPGPIEDES